MTTPQSGREAFEALVEAWRSEVERGTGYLNDESDRAILACADELEAALAQQGREVGEVWQVRVLPVAVKGEDDAHRVEMKRGVQSFRVGPDYWDTREEAEAYADQLRIALAAPKQQAVEWRPIETAPKDGSRIMLANEHGVWMADWRPVYQSGYRPENPWGSAMLNHDHIPREVRYVRATHWKPLPALPGKTEVDRG